MARVLDGIKGHRQSIERIFSALSANRLPQTLLFAGPEGVGKSLVAQALAQDLLCENPSLNKSSSSRACGLCPSCLKVERGKSESVLNVIPDGASVKVDQARDILKFASLKSWVKNQVVIINEAHKLNPQAANSLLKTLEEPAEGCFFILLAPSVSSILPTLRSRSQVWSFSTLSLADLKQISSSPDWMLKACQGRLDILAYLQEEAADELRADAIRSMIKALSAQGSFALEQITPYFKDRTQALLVLRTWQQALRDLRFLQSGLDDQLIHHDFLPDYKALLTCDVHVFDRLSEMALILEADINANLERSLCFESYINQVEKIMENSYAHVD